MKMEYLKEFYTLAEFLNFTNAAEKLYITQPALSRHITSMEEELGVTLLKRTTKSVELTKAGAMLHDALPLDEFMGYFYGLAGVGLLFFYWYWFSFHCVLLFIGS